MPKPVKDKRLTGAAAPPVHHPAFMFLTSASLWLLCFCAGVCERIPCVVCVDIRIDGLSVAAFNAR